VVEQNWTTTTYMNRPAGLIIAIDITERVRLEKELLNAYHSLKEESERKTDFTNAAAHELRTPPTPIIGYTDIPKFEVKDERHLRFLEIIERNVLRQKTLVNRMLELASLDAGMAHVHRSEFALRPLVVEIADNYRAINPDIHVEVPGGMLINTDPDILRHVLDNLISNAVKYSDNDKEVEIRVAEACDSYRFSVKDHGAGIPEGRVGKDLRAVLHRRRRQRQPHQRPERSRAGPGQSLHQPHRRQRLAGERAGPGIDLFLHGPESPAGFPAERLRGAVADGEENRTLAGRPRAGVHPGPVPRHPARFDRPRHRPPRPGSPAVSAAGQLHRHLERLGRKAVPGHCPIRVLGDATESLLLALSIACLYYARRGGWVMAGALDFSVPPTRLPGLATLVPLTYEYLRQHRTPRAASRWPDVRALIKPELNALLLPIIGFGIWVAFNNYLTGDLFGFIRIQSTWGGHFTLPPVELLIRLLPNRPYIFTGAIFTIAALALMIYFYKKVDFGGWLFGALVICIPLFSTQSGYSMLRYLAVVFPPCIIAAKVTKDRRIDIALTIALVILQAILMAFWTCWSPLIV
jgi:hypothetical protein